MDTKALRQKILDLAIRGKLVPQDPTDEPASVLLERIRMQKQQMVKEGKLKAKDVKDDTVIFVGEDNLHYEKMADGSVKCIEDEIPFELPEGWAWTRLSALFDVGSSKRVLQSDWRTNGIPFYRAREIVKLSDNGFVDNDLFISFEHYNKLKAEYDVPQSGDLMVTGVGTIGKVYIVRAEDSFYYKDASVLCFKNRSGMVNSEYAKYLMESTLLQEQIHSKTYGTTVDTITITTANTYLCVLPPLAEQDRIVKAVINWSITVKSIKDNMKDLKIILSTTKSRILDLAIRGKLVPQDPNDEPASVLLERIRMEKEELIKQGKIKRDKKESVIFRGEDNSYYEKVGDEVTCINDDIPFDLPDGWQWERLGNITRIERGGSPRPIKEFLTSSSAGINWIKISDTEKNGKYILSTKERIKPDGVSKSRFVHSGDFLLTNSMSFGRPYILKIDGCIHDGWLVIGEVESAFEQDYLYYTLCSKFMYKTLAKMAGGSTVDNLNSELVKSLLFPIPPKKEQQRISQAIEHTLSIIATMEEILN